MKKLYLLRSLACIALALPLAASAQTSLCNFETTDYDSIGVYDSWARSPFMTGELPGNVAVVPNPFPGEADNSSRVLGFQRSRFGSHLYGALIKLKTPFALTTTTRYVHVLLNIPTTGRVMLIGLGKRDERALESDRVEQFWEFSLTKTTANEWCDAVFAIKGNNGITVSSLVVVPDCESPHALAADFAAYFDDIVINNSPASRYIKGDYILNIEATATHTRSDRLLNSITLTGSNGVAQTISTTTTSPYLLYQKKIDTPFLAMPGETLTPRFGYSGTWMDGYVYLDYGCDGRFSWDIGSDNKPAAGSDIVSYSFYTPDGSTTSYNSTGAAVTHDNENSSPVLRSALPSFTLPATMVPGFYRLRYKVDWDNVDPGGNVSSSNSIISNAGAIVDACINVHNANIHVTVAARNGEVMKEDSTTLSGNEVPFAHSLALLMAPAPGFRQNGLIIRHGYMQSDSLLHGTPQWSTLKIPSFMVRNNRFTLPASFVDGDLEITAEFAEAGSGGEESGNYAVNFDANSLETPAESYLRNVLLIKSDGSSKSITLPSTAPIKAYQDMTDTKFVIKAGETLTPRLSYRSSSFMDGYFYIDYNNDGNFTCEIGNDHRPTVNSELVSYTRLGGYNSNGVAVEAGNAFSFPSFSLPDVLPTGVYRARFKVDWDCADAGGRMAPQYSDSLFSTTGGEIVDFLLLVADDSYQIMVDTQNGNVFGSGSTALPLTITAGGSSLSMVATPVRDGYQLRQFTIIHGVGLNGDSIVGHNRQWSTLQVPFAAGTGKKAYSLLASKIDGDVKIIVRYANVNSPYEPLFSDEFNATNGTQPASSLWSRCVRYSSAWNRYLSNSDAVCYLQDGLLHLKAIPNPNTATDNVPMLTGGIESAGKFSFLRGYIEARILVNPYSGNFPAFWMMPSDGSAGWPKCGEMDIMENINSESKAYHTVHSNWTWTLGNKSDPTSSFSETLDMTRYHTYALEWVPDSIYWFVDGRKVGQYYRVALNAADGQWPFDKSFYIILNQSVGDGSWASSPDVTHTYEMLVDWVRVYQKSKDDAVELPTADEEFCCTASQGMLTLHALSPMQVNVSDVAGRTLYHAILQGWQQLPVVSGLYMVNGKKIFVR